MAAMPSPMGRNDRPALHKRVLQSVEDDAAFLVTVISRPNMALTVLTKLATVTDWPLARVEEAVAAGVLSGELELWADDPAGPSVTLSPSAQSRRGLKLRVNYDREIPAYWWGRAGGQRSRMEKRPKWEVLESKLYEDSGGSLARSFTDPLSDPLGDAVGRFSDVLEDYHHGRATRDDVEAAAARGCTLVGLGPPWLARKKEDEGTECLSCHGRFLLEDEYCVRCDRGFEFMILPGEQLPPGGDPWPEPEPEPKPKKPPKPNEDPKLPREPKPKVKRWIPTGRKPGRPPKEIEGEDNT